MSEFIVMQNRLVQCESDLAAARAEIERLEHLLDLSKKTTEAVLERAERDEARRQVAMVYEVAAQTAKGEGESEFFNPVQAIRAMTPADASAALEAYGREKEREGMQKAANIARRSYERNKRCPDGCNCGDGFHIEQRILAEMEKLK